MKKIISTRGTGKTASLILMAGADEDGVFVCRNANAARIRAHELGISNLKILTYKDIYNIGLKGIAGNLYIDEITDFLEYTLYYLGGTRFNLEGYSLSID